MLKPTFSGFQIAISKLNCIKHFTTKRIHDIIRLQRQKKEGMEMKKLEVSVDRFSNFDEFTKKQLAYTIGKLIRQNDIDYLVVTNYGYVGFQAEMLANQELIDIINQNRENGEQELPYLNKYRGELIIFKDEETKDKYLR